MAAAMKLQLSLEESRIRGSDLGMCPDQVKPVTWAPMKGKY